MSRFGVKVIKIARSGDAPAPDAETVRTWAEAQSPYMALIHPGDLEDLGGILEVLRGVPTLRMLFFAGKPWTVPADLPTYLRTFDGLQTVIFARTVLEGEATRQLASWLEDTPLRRIILNCVTIYKDGRAQLFRGLFAHPRDVSINGSGVSDDDVAEMVKGAHFADAESISITICHVEPEGAKILGSAAGPATKIRILTFEDVKRKVFDPLASQTCRLALDAQRDKAGVRSSKRLRAAAGRA